MNILIIDTETTGVDPTQDRVIEIGAILYSALHQTTLFQLSFLLESPDNPAEKINRIPPKTLLALPANLESQCLTMLQNMASEASYAVAHNAEFDSQWFTGHPLPVLMGSNQEPLRWLCTMSDMTWPQQVRPNESLVSLALNHGIGVGSAHRALTDCQLIAELFNRLSTADLIHQIFAQALRPKALFKAEVDIHNKDMAKAAGFRWNPSDKTWTRRMAIADTANLPFKVTKLANLP